MKILFTAELESIHTAKWINQLENSGLDVYVIQAALPINPINRELKVGKLLNPFIGTYGRVVMTALNKLSIASPALATSIYARHLAKAIRELQPDIVHSLGLNVNWRNSCMPLYDARKALGSAHSFTWLYSSWGTDLDYYARMSAARREEVKKILASVDAYVSECDRDYRLAREMGFSGMYLGKLPAFGGVDVDQMERHKKPGPSSLRKSIYLKGRDIADGDPIGRAMKAMNLLGNCQRLHKDMGVIVGQAGTTVSSMGLNLGQQGVNVEILPRLPYNILLDKMGSCRSFVSLTINDGLPSTLVEAMALGALPVFSGLEPIREWVKDGVNGLLVDPSDGNGIATAFDRVCNDDELINKAAEYNARIVKDQLSADVVRPKVLRMYESAAASH